MKIKTIFDLDALKERGGNIYLMSDLHYNHLNILKMGERPFETLDDMNKYIEQELDKLKPSDILFDLGDLFWNLSWDKCRNVLDHIKSTTVYKILGNHDKVPLYYGKQAKLDYKFTCISDILEITVKYQGKLHHISLCHYPLLEWNHQYYGGLMIHGHAHGNIDWLNESVSYLRADVGFDSKIAKEAGSFLVPLENIIAYFYNKTGGQEFFDWAKTEYKKKIRED